MFVFRKIWRLARFTSSSLFEGITEKVKSLAGE